MLKQMAKQSKPVAKKTATPAKTAEKTPVKAAGKFPKIAKGKKPGIVIRIENLAKLADEASKVIAADKGKSTPKILTEKVKAKMKPPSKARISVLIALAAKEVGKSHEQVVAAFLAAKAFKGVFKKVQNKLGPVLNDAELLEEIDSMNTAIYKFIESSYALGRKKKQDNYVEPGDADETEEEEVKPKSKAPVKSMSMKKKGKFIDPGDAED
jgi:hypothetical protein